MQLSNPRAIFAGETALYLNDMIDTEYKKIEVYMPWGASIAHLKRKGISVKFVSPELHALGQISVESMSGNMVTTYDKERCFCEAVLHRQTMEVSLFQSAIKAYMSNRAKRLSVLMDYAAKLKIRDEVMKYVEVFT